MNVKINNKFLDQSLNENNNKQNILNSKKKISIVKAQIINERGGYKEIMQKKNVLKNYPLLSSHNNYSNISNNVIYSNENEKEKENENIYLNNIQMNSSINIGGNLLPKYENKKMNNISNISRESSENISEMSFGVAGIKNDDKEISTKINNDINNSRHNIRSKRVQNNSNILSSCSVDNKINYTKNRNIGMINKKMDKKNCKEFITPLKGKAYNDNSKSKKKINKEKISHDINIKKANFIQKIKNETNLIKNRYKNNEKKKFRDNSKSISKSKSKSKSKTKQSSEKYDTQLKTPLSYYKHNFKNKKEILNINQMINNNKKIKEKKNSTQLNTYFLNVNFVEQAISGKNKNSIKRKSKNNHLYLNNSNNNTNNNSIHLSNKNINNNKYNINKNINKNKTNQYSRYQKFKVDQKSRSSIGHSNGNSLEKKHLKNYNNITRKSLDIDQLNQKKNFIDNIYKSNEGSIDNINNKEQKSINILPLNLNECFLNSNNNFNNLVLSLKNQKNKSTNKNSNNNSISKRNRKEIEKAITQNTKLISIKLNNNKLNNLDNALIKSIQLKNKKNNNEELNRSFNYKNNKSNYNNKNIISIKYNNNNCDNIKNNENILLNSNLFYNINDNSTLLNKSLNINPNLIIKNSNLSDSSASKRNKKNINNNISTTDDKTSGKSIQTFRDKKGKISTEKENLKNYSNDQIKDFYDDSEGNLKIKIGEILIDRYEVIKNLGKGTFGNCFQCYDKENNEDVCIKIIKNLPKYNEQAKEEIKLINYINSSNIINENIFVQIKNNFIYHEHICIVFELLGNNLYEEIQKNNYNGFNILTIKKLAIQLLFGLLILKTKKIIHCDLKPENILLINKGKNNIKIIDFGSSCLENENYYLYIQSRFYRAPEILLGLPYGVEIDIWRSGCILCEFYTGMPIFPWRK